MNISDCYCLGRITKPWGVKGQLVLFLDVDSPDDYLDLDSAFVEIKGQLVPHFFHIDNINGNKAVATFEDLTPEQAGALVGHELYLPLDLLPKLDGNRFYFHEVIGFTVIDERLGEIGTCQDFLEVSNNPIMQVNHNGTEILIPASQQFVTQVDRENRILHVSTPEGLVEIYLQ